MGCFFEVFEGVLWGVGEWRWVGGEISVVELFMLLRFSEEEKR